MQRGRAVKVAVLILILTLSSTHLCYAKGLSFIQKLIYRQDYVMDPHGNVSATRSSWPPRRGVSSWPATRRSGRRCARSSATKR